ncbi:MAG TPA: glycolate oxidase subunit GlcF [Steroidobacteraceae bacterium]|jgi:glycolate oxidase iron-sulfur subunit|nr:glycolate oxidase subunit GlcF [Steroidobacteraceae bacterium]
MQTALADFIKDTPAGREADAILRSCVHCGFCLPACPTYQLLGDELDSPRGRIYLMKQVLEGEPATASTQLHLDRCLTCRACESACPSGVQYGRLLDIGRGLTEQRVRRAPAAWIRRYLLRKLLPYPRRVTALLTLAGAVRPLLPRALQARVPAPASAPPPPRRVRGAAPRARHVVLLEGCVQPALAAHINPAAARLLASLGIGAVRPRASCCGALAHHLAAHSEALAQVRRNVDLLWPHVDAGAEAVVATASACAAMVSDYGRLLQHDPAYAARAARIAELARDISQVMHAEGPALRAALAAGSARRPVRVAFQAPCTLQHALRVKGVVEPLLLAGGFTLTEVSDGHRCCGSAGTYSLLQPQLAGQLLRAKVAALEAGGPEVIATANIGCLVHIASATAVPVRHWVELLASSLTDA